MRILYAAAEMVPFAKVGGLADVAGALTRELALLGHEVYGYLPVYPSVRRHWEQLAPRKISDVQVPLGDTLLEGAIHVGAVPGSPAKLILLECDPLYDRPNPYVDPTTGTDWPDNPRRFGFFCRALPIACTLLEWVPDVLHLNDYQLGLLALIMKEQHRAGVFQNVAICYSIHNLGYQGIFPAELPPPDNTDRSGTSAARADADGAGADGAGPDGVDADGVGSDSAAVRGSARSADAARDALAEVLTQLGLREDQFWPMGPLEFHGRVNLMKAGLWYADLITTVSPTYAEEIQTPEHGFGLDGVLRDRSDHLIGILNGIDADYWNPETDPLIPYNYGPSDFQRKRENKRRLLEVTHLPVEDRTPVIGMVGRLVEQKGLDILAGILDTFLKENEVRIVVLGSGQPEYETLLKKAARRFPKKLAVSTGFDEPLAHLIEAGSDFFLMPSRYEPCGLNQMYSMRYGTIPIVRRTGGLADTVEEFNPERGTGSGFVFTDYSPGALRAALERALAAYQHTSAFKALITRVMRRDFSWAHSARKYIEAYEWARAERTRSNEEQTR